MHPPQRKLKHVLRLLSFSTVAKRQRGPKKPLSQVTEGDTLWVKPWRWLNKTSLSRIYDLNLVAGSLVGVGAWGGVWAASNCMHNFWAFLQGEEVELETYTDRDRYGKRKRPCPARPGSRRYKGPATL